MSSLFEIYKAWRVAHLEIRLAYFQNLVQMMEKEERETEQEYKRGVSYREWDDSAQYGYLRDVYQREVVRLRRILAEYT